MSVRPPHTSVPYDPHNEGLRALIARGRDYRDARRRLATEGTEAAKEASAVAAARLLDAALAAPDPLLPEPPPTLPTDPLGHGDLVVVSYQFSYAKSLPRESRDPVGITEYWWWRESETIMRQIEGYAEMLLGNVADRIRRGLS